MQRSNWSFGAYIEEIIMISEIIEIPGMSQKRDELLKEVWLKFPTQCEELDLHKGDSN